MSKSLNFKGLNRTHAQILTLCVCGLDQRKMAFSHGLEDVLLHDSQTSLCRDLNKPRNRSSYRTSVQPEGYLKSTQLSDYDREFNW